MELIDVDMVSAQGTQAALQVLPEPVRRLGGGFVARITRSRIPAKAAPTFSSLSE